MSSMFFYPKKKKSVKQYTKKLINRLLFLVTVTVLIGLYINYKNGFSVDNIVTSLLDALKYSVPTYFAKSLFETDKEKSMEYNLKLLELENKKFELDREKFLFDKERTDVNDSDDFK